MMTSPTDLHDSQSQLVVLAKYPKGHYRHCVNPNWHVYADLAFPNNEGGKKSASDLVLDLKGKGVKAKIEYRDALDARAEDDDYNEPKACLRMVPEGESVETHEQSPVDAAIVELYQSLDQAYIDGMGAGARGGFVLQYDPGECPIRSAMAESMKVTRRLIKQWPGKIHRNGAATLDRPETDTFYHVSCEKYGCPTIAITKIRERLEKPVRVFGKYQDSRSVWVTGILDDMGINMTRYDIHSGWYALVGDRTAAKATAAAEYTLALYVQQRLIAIRDSSQ